MRKTLCCLVLLLFSTTVFSQDLKYSFSSRYVLTSDGNGGYKKGNLEKSSGLFYFDIFNIQFELKDESPKQLNFEGVAFDDSQPALHEMVIVYPCTDSAGDFEIKLYQFHDKRIQIFSSYGGKNYLYIIDKVIDEDGTVYSVKI